MPVFLNPDPVVYLADYAVDFSERVQDLDFSAHYAADTAAGWPGSDDG